MKVTESSAASQLPPTHPFSPSPWALPLSGATQLHTWLTPVLKLSAER